MDKTSRRQLADRVLSGYDNGLSATERARAKALRQADTAQSMVLVEGASDQIAIESLAVKLGRELDSEHTVVLPVGGAHGVATYLLQFGPRGEDLRLTGLCDLAEEEVYRRALIRGEVGSPQTRESMQRLGFHVCVEDLEDELIRAVGCDNVEQVFYTQGDLSSFRTLQRQSAWRGKPIRSQIRRFLSSGARRKLRYARLFIEALEIDQVPPPLAAVIPER